MKVRVGLGYDVHALVEGRELWLGGIRLEHDRGLLGHSDADVLIHAVCDALLGAANLRDIGFHFPDTDPAYKGADSKLLLRETARLVRRAGYHHESPNKGNRKYFTVGAGFRMSVFSLDAAYLVSTAQSNPLDQTLRFSLAFDMDGIRDLFGRRR